MTDLTTPLTPTPSRRTALRQGAALAAAVALPFPVARAQTAEFVYKYANNMPVSHPLNVRAREMAEAIRTETQGRVQIQIFPSNQLGSDTDTLSQLRAGGVDFFTLSGLILSALVPAASINGIAFAFPDYPSVWRAMDGSLGAYVRGQIEKANLVVMDNIWDSGFRQITSNTKPIRSPDDLKGFKIRVPVSPMWTSMFKAFDSAPTSLNFSEVYSALQTRIVDGQETPLVVINTAKFYEVQKHCSLTNHMWDGFWFLGNRRAWERLPADLRPIVARNINQAALLQRKDMEALDISLQRELEGKGLSFTKVEPAAFRQKLQAAGFYAEWKAKFGDEAWARLESTTGKLA
jgi:tripartite ATP-independent transporter DctP family solute receptor